jgi:regulator of extracellular matrix RemA (YlzA/DUF370 family)
MKAQGLVAIGHGNFVSAEKVVVILSPNTMAVKRLKETVRGTQSLVDATHGKRTRAVILTDSGHIILSSNTPETLSQRLGTRGVSLGGSR